MKKLVLFFFASTLLLTGCTELSTQSTKDMARAQRVNGLLVFMHSEPLTEYEVMQPQLKHDAISETFNEAKDKKFGEALGDMLTKAVENMSLRDQVYKMAVLAKEKHPDADGLIINDKVFEAQVIKFK